VYFLRSINGVVPCPAERVHCRAAFKERKMAVQRKSTIRKEKILKAAERIFAQKGFQETTISDVAQEAGVSDATIYEYFTSKEELLFSIPGETARKGKEVIELHLKYIRGAANKLRAVIYHYLEFYQREPDYASVAMLILKQNRKFLETKVYQDVREMSRLIIHVINEGVSSGEFKPNIDPNLARSMILGTIEHMVIRSILLGKPKNLLDFVDPLTDLLVDGLNRQGGAMGWNLRINLEPQGEPPNDKPAPRPKSKSK
jgi:TetR/AcrR family transcriptional regulator, fatty acid metabolism regulator protein